MRMWKLSTFDLFSVGMAIKGAWIYKDLPDASALQASLDALLRSYPQLSGRYDAKLKSVVWDGHEAPIELAELDCSGHSVQEDMYELVPEFNTGDFKKGKSRALAAYRIKLDDGAAIVIQGAHALMDGATFYRIAGDWGKMTAGLQVEPMTVNQDLLPAPDALTKEQTLERVRELGWSKMGFKSLFRMLFNLAAMRSLKGTYTIEISQEDLSRMRKESGAGTNAVLCHHAVGRLLEKFPSKERFTLVEVADLRGRACGVPEDFCGNFSQAVVIGEFGVDADAAEIQEAVAAAVCDNARIGENVQLSICSSRYGLPYFMFDASEMNSRDPKLFYVNNQLKFKACEIDFGTGMPVRVQQATLPDMIKFWQASEGGPVQIIYGSFAAKAMKGK